MKNFERLLSLCFAAFDWYSRKLLQMATLANILEVIKSHLRLVPTMNSIGVESLHNFKINHVKFYCAILSNDLLEGNFR